MSRHGGIRLEVRLGSVIGGWISPQRHPPSPSSCTDRIEILASDGNAGGGGGGGGGREITQPHMPHGHADFLCRHNLRFEKSCEVLRSMGQSQF